MSKRVTISLDAMGGDHAPIAVVRGAGAALRRNPDLRFIFFGDEVHLQPLLDENSQLKAASSLFHTDVAVSMKDKPSRALRAGRRSSSMWLAIDAVRKGEADLAISAGNTGALMAMARFCLKTAPGVDRPALAVLWPTTGARGQSVVLDMGASVGANAQQLVKFALMGEAMARALFGLDRPTVGLLNIGVEEMKGTDEIQGAHKILKELDLPMQYVGFIEGDELFAEKVDVAVTEGFCGNIALKTAEGAHAYMAYMMRRFVKRKWWLPRLIYSSFLRSAYRSELKSPVKNVGGGLFLGLDGIVLKSHGSADAISFSGAIQLGHDLVHNKLRSKIESDFVRCYGGEDVPIRP